MEGADDSVFRAPRVTASSGDKTGPHETWTAYRAHRESGGGIGNVEAIRSPRDHRGGRARPGGKRHRDRVLTDVESTENARARSRLRASRDAPAPPPSAPWRETSRVPAEEPRRLALTEKTRRASRGRLPPPRRSRKRSCQYANRGFTPKPASRRPLPPVRHQTWIEAPGGSEAPPGRPSSRKMTVCAWSKFKE